MKSILWPAVTILATAVLVGGHLAGIGWPAGVAKMVASTGFILTGVAAGATTHRVGRIVLAGLVLSWFGDLFLIGSGDTYFQLGLVSFLSGHVAYSAAFLAHGVRVRWVGAALVPVLLVGGFVLNWLLPNVPSDMLGPVCAYFVVITAMVVLAIGARGAGAPLILPLGAVCFYFSDISVASGKFVPGDFPHYVWGLPLYFGGQLLIARAGGGARGVARHGKATQSAADAPA